MSITHAEPSEEEEEPAKEEPQEVKQTFVKPPAEELPAEEQPESSVTKWTSELPPTYRKEGAQLIQKLQEAGLTVSKTGIIEIDGLNDYPIGAFLRTTCVPFHQGTIPPQLQEWLKTKGILVFRNHLATIRPQWRTRYSWRASTMANQQERSVAPGPSMPKPKSKATRK